MIRCCRCEWTWMAAWKKCGLHNCERGREEQALVKSLAFKKKLLRNTIVICHSIRVDL